LIYVRILEWRRGRPWWWYLCVSNLLFSYSAQNRTNRCYKKIFYWKMCS